MQDLAGVSTETRASVLTAQKNEITEYHIYSRLAKATKDSHNRQILEHIAQDELAHYRFWRQVTGEDVAPDRLKVAWYYFISRVLGLTFGIKLMERGEEQAQVVYSGLSQPIPQATRIVADEDRHEHELIGMIDEERLRYVGSVVLGLNDALVELTGALAGLTLALQNTRLIGTAGLITGIAASLSMAASEYLSTKTEGDGREPAKASLYTGVAYVFTVIFLIFPYFLFASYYAALTLTLFNALLVILAFTFYTSVANDVPLRRRFLEMAGISFGVAALSFFIGFLVREFLHIDV
ncbi:MAG: VIT1/CCC1 transporter family protein [Anaerolineae bacterium]